MKYTRLMVLVLALVAFGHDLQSVAKEQPLEAEDAKDIQNAQGGDADLSAFQEAIASMRERDLPLIVSVSFDDFIDKDDVNPVDDRALKIEALYPDLYQAEGKYRAMTSYKVAISPNFHSLIVTYQIAARVMETTLINYDLDGGIIDHQLLAYDEVATDLKKVRSRLSESAITTHHIAWDLVEEIEEQKSAMTYDGAIETAGTKKLSDTLSDYTVVLSVLRELGLDPLAVKTDLIATKTNPENQNEVIVVLPEIADEGEQYFDLNSYILVADGRSGKIIHKYFESSQTNQWVSDAMELQEISLDTAPYRVDDQVRAFGVRVRHSGMSRVNPYDSETLSLFIKSGDGLKKILRTYPMKETSGEWDGECAGEFTDIRNILLLTDQKSNGFYNLKIKGHVITTRNEVNKNAECDAEETEAGVIKELKFDGMAYQPVD